VREAEGGYEIAVAEVEPAPRVAFYRWQVRDTLAAPRATALR
jgi:hypothetical protein